MCTDAFLFFTVLQSQQLTVNENIPNLPLSSTAAPATAALQQAAKALGPAGTTGTDNYIIVAQEGLKHRVSAILAQLIRYFID